MTTSKSIAIETLKVAETKTTDVPRWPLGYSLRVSGPENRSLEANGFKSGRAPPRRWWSHRLYRGPNDEEVDILYSKTKAQSELIAQHFRHEPILGFDMEWPWNDWKRNDLQNKVGLIQIASETRIGLFHIGLHPGKTTEDIIAPTLRTIIESPAIGKVGVNILSADFGRLHKFFGLNPKGAVESSHLYRLVKFGTHKPELVSIKLVSLAHQVEEQLCHSLYKGDVRTSNWSKPLSKDQINYAAADAYAGFMLYHRMNAKRLSMKPVPPLPVYAEKYPRGKSSKDDPILLDAGDGTIITSEAFFRVKPIKSIPAEGRTGLQNEKINPGAVVPKLSLDRLTQALYDDLVIRRASIAESGKVALTRVISDTMLQALARERPSDAKSLLSIKGIGKVHVQKYGDAWLEVISLFVSRNSLAQPTTNTAENLTETLVELERGVTRELPLTPRRIKLKERITSDGSSDSSPAFGTPLQRPPQLLIGLSFTLAETKLDAENNGPNRDVQSYDSDDSLPSLDFGSPSPLLKRKRTESPTRRGAPVGSENLQQLAQPCDSKRNGMPPSNIGGVESNSPHRFSAAKLDMELLTPRSRISRNKLLAFSKLVARKLPARSANAPPVVTDQTLDLIIRTAPRTQEELEKIVGTDSFLLACKQANRDLLSNIIKFAPGRS